MLGAVVWGPAAPFVGMLLDRFGPQVVMPTGSLIMAVGFFVSSFTRTLLHFYVGMGLIMSLGFFTLAMTAQGTTISNWIVSKRGRAMGLVASGIGLGVLIVAPLTQFIISEMGWRKAFRLLALNVVTVVALLNLLSQRYRPQEVGLEPDSGAAPPKDPAPRQGFHEREAWTLRMALRGYRF